MAEPRTGPNLGQGRNSDNQVSNAISAQILSIEPQDRNQPIQRVPVNGSGTIQASDGAIALFCHR